MNRIGIAMGMINKSSFVLSQPYPLFTEPRLVIPGALATSLFITVFLVIFQPFGISGVQTPGKIWYLLGFMPVILGGLLLNYLLLPRLLPEIFEADEWQVGKEIGWLLWNIFSVGVLGDVYFYYSPLSQLRFSQLLGYLGQGLIIAVIPETFYVLLTYSIFLTRRLEAAEQLNRKLSAQLPGEKDLLSSRETLLLAAENGKEVVHVPARDLLFIRSRDNYANIVWQDGGRLKKTLLRTSLKNLEDQISTPRVLRCHRSFIVNLGRVRSITGNARGYRLYLDSYAEPIPVSREAGKALLAQLQKLAGRENTF